VDERFLLRFPPVLAGDKKRGESDMTDKQKALVQESFEKVRPIAETAANLFYNRLFTLDPSLRGLFRGDMNEQGRKLMQMIAAAVTGLDHLEALVPAVEELGRRHVRYGVRDAHYETVGSALLWTLERGLGADFTPEVKEAWAVVYGLLTDVMQRGAKTASMSEAFQVRERTAAD
jgi:hemoglobin-like flavoprotein